jgi:acetylxylan esterase
MALLGYSQGAQVAADVMCGTSETGWTATPPMAGTAAAQNSTSTF